MYKLLFLRFILLTIQLSFKTFFRIYDNFRENLIFMIIFEKT